MPKFDHTPGVVTPVIAFADLGAATTLTGQIVWCPTGIAGQPGLIVSDGTNWVHVADGSTTAAES